MNKSVVVIVELRKWVNKYKTWQAYLRKYMAHDALNTCNIGDVVQIEALPHKLSKMKTFNVVDVLVREQIVVETNKPKYSPQAFKAQPEWAYMSPAARAAVQDSVREFELDHGVTEEAKAAYGQTVQRT